ncbi:MAG: hypothetical protein HC808_14415, partial [Candidatus Competibacteraceae bacterium]|nr:hypothetical protein [Candidatus Competibacteraceae bacterium]
MNLRNHLALANLRLGLAEQWQARLEQLYLQQVEQSRQEAQADLFKRLAREKQAHLERAAELRRRMQNDTDTLSEMRRLWLETSIQGAEDKSQLTQLDIRFAKTAEELSQVTALAERVDVEPKTLQKGLTDLLSLEALTQEAGDLLQRKIDLLAQQQQAIERREFSGSTDTRLKTETVEIVRDLIAEFSRRLSLSQTQMERILALTQRLEQYYKERLNRDLFIRESLPLSAVELQQLLANVIHTPTVLFHQVRLSVEATLKTVVNTSALRWAMLAGLELALVWLVIVTRRSFKSSIANIKARQDESFFRTVVLTVLQLLRKNLLGIGLAVSLALMVWLFQVPQPGLTIIITLVFLWVGIKTPINLAWLLLASPQLPPDKQRPHIYRQVFWTLLVGGILAAMTILAHVSALPKDVISVFDRLFMLYWLWAFFPAMRIRRLLVDLLADRYAGVIGFIIFRFATLLLPMSLLVAAGLGLVGYLNLAWSVAWHLMVFLVVLAGWLMVRGLLGDMTVLLKNYAVIHSSYGLLWTQDVINPLHKVFRLVLFLAAWMVLFRLYGLSGEST